MSFQNLQKIETADQLLDIAFRRAKKTSVKTKGDLTQRAITKETEKIRTVTKTLSGKLEAIVMQFPNMEELPAFYKELASCSMDIGQLRKSLGAVNWAEKQTKKLSRIHLAKIQNSRDLKTIYTHKKSFFGRVSSTLKQIKNELLYTEECRKTLKRFPSIKTDLPTTVISGYPNAGKTSLLKALCGSEPKIAPYPFTTQEIMIGYMGKMQIIDTPGLLDRAARNKIELKAIAALKHLADRIIFVIDPTESCGYSLKEQLNLLEEVATKKTIVVLNKADIAHVQVKVPYKTISVSAEKGIGIEELKKALSSQEPA